MKIGILVPHIFMQEVILPNVIFAPAKLALNLAEEMQSQGHEVTLFTPGKINSKVTNVNADLGLFENELNIRGDTYISLLRKHPFTFITLARQVQNELVAKAMKMANDGQLDILHVYTNEEDTALPFAQLCHKPVVFTHHDPYNFLVKYKSVFPKYPHYNWISISLSQRRQMPKDTNWVANIYHGLPIDEYQPAYDTNSDYVVYLGRIINTKGVHLAIEAVQDYNRRHKTSLKLKIAGKHYSDHQKDKYWEDIIEPKLADKNIEYVGYLKSTEEKQGFLGGARALLVPSLFEEPFGMVMIEALACATPVIGLDSGAIGEVIKPGKNGLIIKKTYKNGVLDEQTATTALAQSLGELKNISRADCRKDFEDHFTLRRMAANHIAVYEKLVKESPGLS